MGRKLSKGSVELKGGVWRALITFPRNAQRPKRTRHWFLLPQCATEAAARKVALKLAKDAAAGTIAPPDKRRTVALPANAPWAEIPARTPDGRETVRGWSERWVETRKARGLKSHRADLGRLHTWVWPSLGALAIEDVTRAHLEAWVERIDAAVRDDELAWKTALNAWGLLTKLFDDAYQGKPLALRVRKDNPAADVRGPDRGARRAKQFLYPSEARALLACPEVPLDVAQVYALAIYLYPRAGELEALACEDVDLRHGTVLFHRATAEDGTTHETKGNRPRRIPVHPHALPLLAHLVARAGGHGRVWPVWPLWKDQAGELRGHLRRAGVTRAELHDGRTATTKPMTFHDLRATGITWEAVAGTDLAKIQQRAGHTTTNTTLIYVRLADEVRGVGFGEVFPPLPPDLIPIGSRIGSPGGEGHAETPWKKAARAVQGEGFEPARPVARGREPLRNVATVLPLHPARTPSGHPAQGSGTNAGTNLRGALEAAVREALDAGDHRLAAELLDLTGRRVALPRGKTA